MPHKNHQLARDFFSSIPGGKLPDSLLTPDMTGWTTLQGHLDKQEYLVCINALKSLFSSPVVFTINSLTAEEDRVVAEVQSLGTLINGEEYRNIYVFVFLIRDGRIASVAEHFNAVIVREKLIPLMKTVQTKIS